MKILVLLGTRPEAIKLSPLIKLLKKQGIVRVCVTGQHREMLDSVLKTFNIQPDFDLAIMTQNQDLHSLTSKLFEKLKSVWEAFHPDCVIVQGDTTTALVGALSAYYKKIKVAHVEGGLRTQHLFSPFPEEMNRQLISRISHWHFVPSHLARDNLLKENIQPEQVFLTGNTVIDALFWVLQNTRADLAKSFNLDFKKKIILVTGHRRESFGQGFENICYALKKIALIRPDIEIIYPVHLNPQVQKPVREILKDITNIHLVNPIEYVKFIHLMNAAYLILTDSGGVQEEAPSLGKPILVMRETTERFEGIKAGSAKLVGTNQNNIINSVLSLLDDANEYKTMAKAINPYGDGRACERICNILGEIK